MSKPEMNAVGQLLPFRQSLLAMLGICLVVVMTAVDQTVVGMALPRMVADLQGFELYAWVATAYMLASVLVIPIVGRLGDYYGRKPFVVSAIIIFTLASALCGLASNMGILVAARALQGIGGGMLLGSAFACVPELFPQAQVRLRWQVLLSSSFGIANALGPTLGGWLTEYAGWRAVFYVNLPIGLVCLWVVCAYLPYLKPVRAQSVRLDWLGALLMALLLASLQLGVELLAKAEQLYLAWGLLLLSALSLGGLVAWERRCSEPLLPLRLFTNWAQAGLLLLSLLTGFGMFALLFYSPLLLQGGLALSPQQAGWLITPLVLCITLGSIINGRIITQVSRPNWVLQAGFCLILLSYGGLLVTDSATSHGWIGTSLLLGGLGFGFVMPNLTLFNQEISQRQDLGIATALMQSFRMIGGLLGTAVVGSVVSHTYSSQLNTALAPVSTDWQRQLVASPSLLVDSAQLPLSEPVLAALSQARQALISAIHLGQCWAALVIGLSLWVLLLLPKLRFQHSLSLATQESSNV